MIRSVFGSKTFAIKSNDDSAFPTSALTSEGSIPSERSNVVVEEKVKVQFPSRIFWTI